MRLAAIDIGTNTVLLTITNTPHPDPLPHGEREILILRDEARITRLGEGLHREPAFLPAAQDRTLEVLKDYKRLCEEAGVQVIKAVGTAAFRKAANASDFVARVQREAGITIEVISGEREAELSYASAMHDFPGLDHLVVLDIGGGSTEIICDRSGGTGKSSLGISLDLGCVVLSEALIRHDPISAKEYRTLEEAIDRKIDAAFFNESLQPLVDSHPNLVGLAGSVTTLSAIKQGLVTWDGARVQGSILTDSDLDGMVEKFRKTSIAEKKKIPGMVAGREDTILAGTLILRKVMDVLGCEQVIVSDRGLRFGLIYEAAGAASI